MAPRFLLLALACAFGLLGCNYQLLPGPGEADDDPRVTAEESADGLVTKMPVGAKTSFSMYVLEQGGMETTGWGCNDDATLTASDPSVVDIRADGRSVPITVNTINHFTSRVFAITAVREGTTDDVGRCDDMDITFRLAVVGP